VAEHLSPAWIAALAEAATQAEAPGGVELVIQQVVADGGPDGAEVAYTVAVADGRVAVHPGRDSAADITFTQDRATAAAIARAELSAQTAFLDGRLRVGGDLTAALAAARVLTALADVFAAPRESTAW
jgi:predicted lipid carrier protein YhbT